MGKTATLNIRVNPDVKENAESVLAVSYTHLTLPTILRV